MQAMMRQARTAMLLLAVLLPSLAVSARGTLDETAQAGLPKEAQATLDLIQKSGPFPYSKDGTTFGNREKILPAKPRGFYREYTVKTPGSRDRGARRIVCGGNAERASEHSSAPCYYTGDHYASFSRIKESK